MPDQEEGEELEVFKYTSMKNFAEGEWYRQSKRIKNIEKIVLELSSHFLEKKGTLKKQILTLVFDSFACLYHSPSTKVFMEVYFNTTNSDNVEGYV